MVGAHRNAAPANPRPVDPFGTALMLGIAYASSIGGVGTIVGSSAREASDAAAAQWRGFGPACGKLGFTVLATAASRADSVKAYQAFVEGCKWLNPPSCNDVGWLGGRIGALGMHEELAMYAMSCGPEIAIACNNLGLVLRSYFDTLPGIDRTRLTDGALRYFRAACRHGHSDGCGRAVSILVERKGGKGGMTAR